MGTVTFKQKSKKVIGYIALIIVFLIGSYYIFQLNNLVGYTGRDYANYFIYQSEWPNDTTKAVSSIWDWIVSVANHTKIWDGLFVSQGLAQLFMQIPKGIFNIINTLVFVILAALVAAFATNKGLKPLYLLFAFIALFLFIPFFGENILWVNGAAHGLWPITLTLLFLLPIRHNYVPKKHRGWFIVAMTILGFLVGASSQMSPAISWTVYLYFRLEKSSNPIKDYEYPGFVGMVLGSVIMLMNTPNELSFNLLSTFKTLWQSSGVMIIFLGILLLGCLVGKLSFKTHDIHSDTAAFYMMLNVVGLTLLLNILAEDVTAANILFSSVFLIITTLILMNKLKDIKLHAVGYGIGLILTAGLLVISIPQYQNAHASLEKSNGCFSKQVTLIKEARDKHKKTVTVPPMIANKSVYSPYYNAAYLKKGKNPKIIWGNAWMAKYFGLEEIKVK